MLIGWFHVFAATVFAFCNLLVWAYNMERIEMADSLKGQSLL